MVITETAALRYDPYDTGIYNNPYPVYRRLRDEAPLYRNDEYDFYALSRFTDIERMLVDRATFLSSRGVVLEMINAGVEIPPGTVIFEDPPFHSIHRGLLSRVFTPRKMLALEPDVREFCRHRLDLLAGAERFDFVADLGAQIPMRVIGMLLGIPEQDQELIRDHVDAGMHPEAGKPQDYSESILSGEIYADYIDWRYEHPSDDLMTALITVEFEDEHGTTRRLTRDEALAYVSIVSGAGNETTNRLIGWTGKLLADHPDARRELASDRSLIPDAIEEILRFEAPPYTICRFVGQDVEFHGQTVPEGSAIVGLPGSAGRDEREFDDPDRFDIHRAIGHHLSFGYGPHFCLGASLARLEARVVLDEVLSRFPDWEVDVDNARLGGHLRGWDALPVVVT
jgi:cytochrome P450